MTASSHIPQHIELVPASPEQHPVLANLLHLYAHDFSEFYDVELDSDGRFTYKHLPLYWRDPNRYPFLVWADGKLAGFALMKRGSEISGDPNVWDLAEFFVIRSHRRRGIGTEIAHQLWRQFPGKWEVRVLQANGSAQKFWHRAITKFAGKSITTAPFEKDGDAWQVFAFESGGPAR